MKVRAAVLALAIAPVVIAQQPSTTTIERGDRDASIRATATTQQSQTTPGQVQEPQSPRTPFVDPPRTAAGTRPQRTPAYSAEDRARFANNSDVYLEVPDLHVDQILLDVERLDVHLALDARIANLVSLKAGVDARIGRVKVDIRGVNAEAYLVVRLDNVAKILDRTLQTLDKNPELLTKLLGTVTNAVTTVGSVANTALQPGGVLSQTVNTLGQTVTRTLDTTGNIVERTLDTAGGLVNERTVGRLLDLPVISQTTNAAGQIVKQVRDTTGTVIEYTLDSAGRIVNSRVVGRGGERR